MVAPSLGRPEDDERLDVIMRMHDIGCTVHLRRAVFSLVCQNYRPLSIYLVTQRFSESDIENVRTDLCPTMALAPAISLEILNYGQSEPKDARSALLNLGIRASRGRYVAFLDYDDVIHPTGYSRLVNELKSSECAIVFGKIVVKRADVFEDALIVERREHPFRGKNVLDLFRRNFCPIHSFVIDRKRVPSSELCFDESLSRAEDYDLLLRICAVHEARFVAFEKPVGDYFYKNDGSNTILLPSNAGEERLSSWTSAEDFLELRRRSLIVSSEVQRSLGISPPKLRLTIRDILDRFDT